MKEKIDFPAFTATRVQAGIVNLNFKKIKEITLVDIQDITAAICELGRGQKVGLFLTFQGFLRLNEEVMSDAGRKEIQKYIYATAYVVRSMAIRLGIKFFMNFYGAKEGMPRNIFETREKAISWLRTIKEEQKQKELVYN